MSREEKEIRVIDLYSQGKTYRHIAEEVRISPNDIHTIIKKKEEEKNNIIVTNKQQQPSSPLAIRAYELFSNGMTLLQVAIALNIRQSEADKYNREYWKLKGSDKLNIIDTETNGNTWPLWKLYNQLIKKRGVSIEEADVVDIAADKPPNMGSLYRRAKDKVDKMQYTRQHLSKDIESLEHKISILDKTASLMIKIVREKNNNYKNLFIKD